MQVSVLASGSKGNSTYIEMDGTRLLVDAGVSTRRIRQELAVLDVDIRTLDGIFITHEHRDHIKGLTTLSKQYHEPIFTRQQTFSSMYCVDTIPPECFQEIKDTVRLGRLSVEAFNIPHDAADPVGYRIRGSRCCTVATDLGFVTSSVQAAIEGADVLVLEANHDPELLRNGSYPWALKRRILSNRGHLSNSDAAWALVRMKQHPRAVFLAHMSEENNRPEIVRKTVQEILAQQGIGDIMALQLAQQNEAVRLREPLS